MFSDSVFKREFFRERSYKVLKEFFLRLVHKGFA